MTSFIGCFVGLVLSVSVGAEPLLEGRVRLASGEPAVGVQVRLFDLADRQRFVGTTTDAAGRFALQAFSAGTAFALGPNYPNPFNPSTLIPFHLPTSGEVRLEVFNMMGQRVATVVDDELGGGAHTAKWDGTDAAGRAVGAGVYLYRLSSGGATVTRRMVLVDGQAGVPVAGAGGPMRAAGAADDPVYGLTVSGEGLVPYVDPAFRVGPGRIAIVVEPVAAGKATTCHEGAANLFEILEECAEEATPPPSEPSDPPEASTDSIASAPSYPGGGRIWWLENTWRDTDTGRRTEDKYIIYRANLDGSNQERVYLFPAGQFFRENFTLDVGRGYMYWLQGPVDQTSVWRAKLDGSGAEEIVSAPESSHVSSYALDVAGNRIFYWWTEYQQNNERWTYHIWWATLDGSAPQEIASHSIAPPYINLAQGRIFWAVEFSGNYVFYRQSLDGRDRELIPSDVSVGATFRIVGSAKGSVVYWTDEKRIGDTYHGIVALADFATDEVNPLGDLSPWVQSLWTVEDRIYWNSRFGLWRTNIDGSDPQEIVRYSHTGVGNVRAYDIVDVIEFTVDLSENRACWVGMRHRDGDRRVVQCASLDGSGLDGRSVEDVFAISYPRFVGGPRRIALDMAGSRLVYVVESEPRRSGFDIESEYSIWRASWDDPELDPEKMVAEVRRNVQLRASILALEFNPED